MKFSRDDIKISFGKPVFYVNEDKKTVVCVLDYEAKFPGTEFFGDTGIYMNDYTGQVKTKAKCHADDDFFAEIGCEIAFARAENAAYNEVERYVAKFEDGLNQYLGKIATFANKYANHNRHNNEYIEELGKKADELTFKKDNKKSKK